MAEQLLTLDELRMREGDRQCAHRWIEGIHGAESLCWWPAIASSVLPHTQPPLEGLDPVDLYMLVRRWCRRHAPAKQAPERVYYDDEPRCATMRKDGLPCDRPAWTKVIRAMSALVAFHCSEHLPRRNVEQQRWPLPQGTGSTGRFTDWRGYRDGEPEGTLDYREYLLQIGALTPGGDE